VSRYSDAEIETGLRALALVSGNQREASSLLRKQGITIPRSTLYAWATSQHATRYRQIQQEVMPAIYDRIAQRSERLADDLADVEERLAEQMRRQAPELAARDTAGALRNVSVAKGIAIDKATVARGRPTQITATADVTDLLKQLASRFGRQVNSEPVDAEAVTEEPDEAN
jgi:hypothetical protein